MLKDNQGADGSPGNLWPHNDAWWRWKLCSLDHSPALHFTYQFTFPDLHFSSVQLLSCVLLFATPQTPAHHASLSITNSQSWLKLMFIESVTPKWSNHFILCCPLLPAPWVIPSIRVFSNESVLRIRWPKYWSFSFSISPSNEYSGLISFRIDWFDLLAVHGTVKSLLQHHSSKTSTLWYSAFSAFQCFYYYV